MSCYGMSNNIQPPRMNDGRNFANWQPESTLMPKSKKMQEFNQTGIIEDIYNQMLLKLWNIIT